MTKITANQNLFVKMSFYYVKSGQDALLAHMQIQMSKHLYVYKRVH